MSNDWRWVTRVLARHDPEGLIKMGAPADEYDGEAMQIHNGLATCRCEGDVARICAEIFSFAFGMPAGRRGDKPEQYASIAYSIWQAHNTVMDSPAWVLREP